jgi:hypothetical protein
LNKDFLTLRKIIQAVEDNMRKAIAASLFLLAAILSLSNIGCSQSLDSCPVQWVSASQGSIPYGAVICGHDRPAPLHGSGSFLYLISTSKRLSLSIAPTSGSMRHVHDQKLKRRPKI